MFEGFKRGNPFCKDCGLNMYNAVMIGWRKLRKYMPATCLVFDEFVWNAEYKMIIPIDLPDILYTDLRCSFLKLNEFVKQ